MGGTKTSALDGGGGKLRLPSAPFCIAIDMEEEEEERPLSHELEEDSTTGTASGAGTDVSSQSILNLVGRRWMKRREVNEEGEEQGRRRWMKSRGGGGG